MKRSSRMLSVIGVLAADWAFASGGFFSAVPISTVYVREGVTDITLASPYSNPGGCSSTTLVRIYSGANPNSSAQVAAAMAAELAGRPIGGFIGSCDSDGAGVLSAVYIG